MSAPEKDWTERFERAKRKPRYGRIVFGIVIIVLKIIQFATIGSGELLGSETVAYHVGALLGDVTMLGLAAWLIYTGRKPAKPKIPGD